MKWSLNNLFPICTFPKCPKYGTRHMLEHQEEIAKQILQGNENYIYLQGGVGSAKTQLWGALAAAYVIMIPGSRIILCRKDFALLYDTLWKYFKDSLQAAVDQGIIKGNFSKFWIGRSLKATSYCELPNGSWARAVQLKSVAEVMGPNYDAIFISDAMENENFGFIFRGEGTVGGLQSRLRGSVSSNFILPNGEVKDMRRFLIESNPPPNINELHDIFGKEPGVRHLSDNISYRHIQISTIQNDHLPSTYVEEIASQHHDKSDIARILQGKTVPYYGGKRVIETFFPELHVSKFTYDKDLPLFVGIDTGYQHPGVTFSQIKRCSYNKEHFITLSEITNLFGKTTNELADYEEIDKLGILQHLRTFYPDFFDYQHYLQIKNNLLKNSLDESRIDYKILEQHFSKIKFCIDKSANKSQPSRKDRKTDNLILLTDYGIRCKYLTNIGLDMSLNRVREHFKKICICNIPTLMIDSKCSLLIDAYSGGYRYTKKRDNTGYNDEPIKDHLYEDIADPHRYTLENFFFNTYVPDSTENKIYKEEEYPWSWMERR